MYLDDIVILSEPPYENVAHMKMILTLLKEACVAPELNKYAFFTNPIDYLCHDLRLCRVKITNPIVGARRELKVSTTVTGLRSFLEYVVSLDHLYRSS